MRALLESPNRRHLFVSCNPPVERLRLFISKGMPFCWFVLGFYCPLIVTYLVVFMYIFFGNSNKISIYDCSIYSIQFIKKYHRMRCRIFLPKARTLEQTHRGWRIRGCAFSREDWMIYRGQRARLSWGRMWFGSIPAPSPPLALPLVRKFISFSVFLCVFGLAYWWEGRAGGGGDVEPNHMTARKLGPLKIVHLGLSVSLGHKASKQYKLQAKVKSQYSTCTTEQLALPLIN